MTVSKRRIHRVNFEPQSEVVRKGVPFHMNSESWDYGRNHAIPLWTEYIIYPAILSRGYKFLQLHQTMSSFELVLEGSMTFQLDDTRLEVKPCVTESPKKNTRHAGECGGASNFAPAFTRSSPTSTASP